MICSRSIDTPPRERKTSFAHSNGPGLSRRVVAVLPWIAVFLLLSHADLPAQGICGRTPQVRDKLMEITRVSDCRAVTAAHLAEVTHMQLFDAGITTLQAHDFKGLSSLENLSIDSNPLATLPSGIFDGLSSLKRLWLDHNSLTALPDGVFRRLSSLELLALQSNSLSELPEGVFRGLGSLKLLALSGNPLTELPEGVFRGLRSLEMLWLQSNSLSRLPEEVFRGLGSLKELLLESNLFRELPEGLFYGLSNLESLDLTGNYLIRLPDEIFHGLGSLKVLSLDWNHLRRLPARLLHGLSRLEQLLLLFNPLRVLPSGLFDDVLDTLGAGLDSEGLTLASYVKARLSFAQTAQTGSKGTIVRAIVILSRSLPVAVRVPYRVSGSHVMNAEMIVSPDPDQGLLFLAGERVKEIVITLAEAGLEQQDSVVLTLGELSQIGLRKSDGSGPDAPHLKSELFLDRPEASAVHTVIVSDRDSARDLEGICGRTPQVRDKLMERLGVSDCADVTAEHLANAGWGWLGFSGSGITRLREDDFKGLTTLTQLDLSDNSLTTLPAGIFRDLSSLKMLWLKHNSLIELPEDAFLGLTSLTWLQLDYNNLITLPEGIFSGLSNLERLWVQEATLETLPEGMFNGLETLKELLLGNNHLGSIPEGIFRGLSNLERLRLDGNDLETIPKGSFVGLGNLKQLNLSYNFLNTLPASVFNGLGSLEELILQSNSLNEVPVDSFSGLVVMKELWLQENNLRHMPKGIFNGLNSLQVLHLYRNSLREIPPGFFGGLSNLRWLTLGWNFLNTLPEGAFRGLDNLSRLWLNNNLLRSIPRGAFNGLDSLSVMGLIENPMIDLTKGIFDDLLDTLGSKYSIDDETFVGGLWVDPQLKATVAFASTAQRVAEGKGVRVPVTLSRALPVAVRVPYAIGFRRPTGGFSGLSPAPERGLLFPAGETRREVSFSLLRDDDNHGERPIVFTLGTLDAIRLRPSDGMGPDAPHLEAGDLLFRNDEAATHTVTAYDSSPNGSDPFCVSLWPGSPCSTVATLPHVLLGTHGESAAETEVLITHRAPEPSACEIAVLFDHGSSLSQAVSFNGRFLESNLFFATIPKGGAEILTIRAPDAQEPVTGAVYVFSRSSCTPDTLYVQGRYQIESRTDGEIDELVSVAGQSPRDWLGDGDCRRVTGVFGNGRDVIFSSVTAEPSREAPPGTQLHYRAFDLNGNFIRHLTSLEISGESQVLSSWELDRNTTIQTCLDVPGTSDFELAVSFTGIMATGNKMQFATERLPTDANPDGTDSDP